MSDAGGPRLSVVVPVFDEEENVRELYLRTAEVLDRLGTPWEIVFVDDGSRDRSLALIRELRDADPRVRYRSLSRNFGHQVAITAGLDAARGDAVVVMDGDLQDPPELIPELVAKWTEGFEVVYAVRRAREGLSPVRVLVYEAFYRLLRRLARIEIPVDSGDFRLLSRRVVETLQAMPERNRFVRGLVAWVGLKQTGVSYERPPRHGGDPKYSLAALSRLAVDGLVSFSFVPLQLATWFGFAISAVCAVYTLYAIYVRLAYGTPPPGWTSLMVAMLFLGGVQLLTLGIIGEYVGRVFDEVKQRPLYVVEEASDPER
jgi:dolichol-phosphate mannosyltransferase